MKKWLQQLFKTDSSSAKKKKTRYVIAVGLFGIVLLLMANLFTPKKEEPDEMQGALKEQLEEPAMTEAARGKKSETTDLESNYEEELRGMLEKIQGISDVEVMVNLDSTDVQVYEKNLVSGKQTTDETDTNGGSRTIEDQTEETQTVLVRQGDKEVPLLVHTKKPKVRGVFIIAKGTDSAETKKWVVESVSRVLDVPTHRVSVIPKK
ncbi:stage III sporulation protein AG [Aciduricibacillus chroicocephali]|uniref:Stage III sporulation protein AG n=1 Tax=Aciduricibacillus chroicocephali TaxID=3054939 RepID=A0ABY9KS44_9BACI|nr:stage III sporulation protein AG [Bacillaceae bacterium 44XB]